MNLVYVGTDGHVDLKSTNGVAAGGLTTGFILSGNDFAWAQGDFFACPHTRFYAAGPPTYMIYASRPGANLPQGCTKIALKKTAI